MSNEHGSARTLALIAVAAVALMIGAFQAGPTLAGKPDRGTGGGGAISVSPDPAAYMTDTLNISGSGFGAGQRLMITVAGSFPGAEVTADGSGSFSLTWTRWGGGFGEGDHWVTASKYQGKRSVTVATDHFWVCGAAGC
jgi:hypothetical protein